MKRLVVAAVLSWDGARRSKRGLSSTARAFLEARNATRPSAKKVAQLFAADLVEEIRICWVPTLRGGTPLADSFAAPDQKRVAFKIAQVKQIGDVLAVLYRRSH